MQAFANIATAPVRKTTQAGKCYWEFRAAESAKNEPKESATWYTVRLFQPEDPGFSKGDFVRIIGKLKLDAFVGRDGKPLGVLVVMCYEAKKYEKSKPATPESASPVSSLNAKANSDTGSTSVSSAPSVELSTTDMDESWLALVT